MRLTLKSCGMELAALDADPSWRLSDVLRTLPERFREKRYRVRAFFDVVELCGESTLSDIGASDGAVLTIVRSKSPLSLKVVSHYHGSAEVCLATSGERLLTLTGLGARLSVALLSPDGDYVLTLSEDDKLVKLWSTASGECVRTLTECDSPYSIVQILPDGERVLVTSDGGSAKIWSIASGECLYTFAGHDGVEGAEFSPDGERVLILSSRGSPKIWSIASGECVELLSQGHQHFATFSSDGERALTTSRDSEWAKIWSTTSGECLHTLTHGEHVHCGVFSPYGEHVLTECTESAKVWCTESGECLCTLTGVGQRLEVIKFSPSGEHVLTAGCNFIPRDLEEQIWPQIWSIASGELLHTLTCSGDTLESATFSPDGDRVLTVSHDGGMGERNTCKLDWVRVEIWQIWSTASGECLQTLTEFKGSVEAAFSLPTGEHASAA